MIPRLQGAVALAFFADAEWQKRLPHDETGEAKRLHRWIEKRMAVCKWVGLGVLLLQASPLAFRSSVASLRIKKRMAVCKRVGLGVLLLQAQPFCTLN